MRTFPHLNLHVAVSDLECAKSPAAIECELLTSTVSTTNLAWLIAGQKSRSDTSQPLELGGGGE